MIATTKQTPEGAPFRRQGFAVYGVLALLILACSALGVGAAASLPPAGTVAQPWVTERATLITYASPVLAAAGSVLLILIGRSRPNPLSSVAFVVAVGLVANLAAVALARAFIQVAQRPAYGRAMVASERVFDVGLIKALLALWLIGWAGFVAEAVRSGRRPAGSPAGRGILGLCALAFLLPSTVVAAGAGAYMIESSAAQGDQAHAWAGLLVFLPLLVLGNVAGGIIGRLLGNRALLGGLTGALIATLLVLLLIAMAGGG